MEPNQPYLINDVINWGKNKLIKANIENIEKEIEWFFKKKLNISIPNYSFKANSLSLLQFQKFKKFINRRSNNEPFQYIIGFAPFYEEDFLVNKHVLIPRPETEMIINILKNQKKTYSHALDVGTGSGNLAITLELQNIASKITAIDISSKAIQVAQENAKRLFSKNIHFVKNDFLKNDFLNKQKFDLIVSNPPYINKTDYKKLEKQIYNNEPKVALTDCSDGFTFYRRFSKVIKKILKPCGKLFLEIGLESTKKQIETIFLDSNYHIKWYKDYNNSFRIIEIYYE